VFTDAHERLHREVEITCFFGALSTDLEVENIAPDSEGSLGAPHRIYIVRSSSASLVFLLVFVLGAG
jgi:hypothetical protein